MIDAGIAIDAIPCLALDIGGTKIEGALVHPDGRIERRERLDTASLGEDLLTPICAMLDRVSQNDAPKVLGVGCAGPMTRGGEEVSPLNIQQWDSFPLRAELVKRLGLDVYIEGDARALALAEGVFGSATLDEGYLSMVVSTGIGGGIVLDGRLLDGVSGNAGHVGHVNVVINGRPCSCGGNGCLEAEASGWAIEAITGKHPREADEFTRRRTAELVGRAVAALAVALDFDRCYIAGSVALGFGDDFFTVANQSARTLATLSFTSELKVSPSGLGVDGPILGAALVGWRGDGQ